MYMDVNNALCKYHNKILLHEFLYIVSNWVTIYIH